LRCRAIIFSCDQANSIDRHLTVRNPSEGASVPKSPVPCEYRYQK
jgi:hypothetical protein